MDAAEKTAGTVRERLHAELEQKARGINCVCNEIFTVKYWQLALNFVLGLGAVILLVVSLVFDDTTVVAACAVTSIALVIILVVYNMAVLRIKPMSVRQYTAIVKGRRYCFQLLTKTRSLYYDGERSVEVGGAETIESDGVYFPQFAFDFFAEMSVDVRIGKADREIYKGRLDVDGASIKCRIVFKDGMPYYGAVGGARIKYFDVNDTHEKFVVPSALKHAAEEKGLSVIKLSGVHYR